MRALAAVVALAIAASAMAQPDEAARFADELSSGRATIGTDFTLTDPQGRARSLRDFRGKAVALYFGYTFCPDVCPTDLQNLAHAWRALGKRRGDLQIVFVTLDPQRDTAELLGQYVKAFHARIVALRGSEEETRRIARAFRVYYQRRGPAGSSDYAIDHAAYTLLIGRGGNFRDFIRPGTPSGRMAVMMEELVADPR
jgi:protein SCO1/2